MVSRASEPMENLPPTRPSNGTPVKSKAGKTSSSPAKHDEKHVKSSARDVAELNDYQLGDCLGKGAFGSVYRALNWGTGETVAIKQIKLADLPKNEMRVIMLEIDLLKNLDHPNIVKYHGFVKTPETLNIILEYCENGSLHSISKNFGRFPENLVGLYMSQVLHGLLYLHEQGVIHRDIKGANILTTKQGLVKLADFGVASRTTGLHDSTVVGTPYWMAPEVIELSGATTASDVWSLGCTVIELLDGKPPYYKLQPMQALFRIVNDDHPPLPQGASPAVRDFLMQCFQKDPNLRVSARKLLKHPWIVSARRSDSVVPKKSTEYEEAVKSVQEWNEALRSPNAGSLRKASKPSSGSPIPARKEILQSLITPAKDSLHPPQSKQDADRFRSPEGSADDNWDDDFASAISPSALHLPHLRPHDNFGGMLSSEKLKAFASFESVTDQENQGYNAEGDLTVKCPMQPHQSDPLQTIRPATKKSEGTRHSSKRSDPKVPRKSSFPPAPQSTNLQKSKPSPVKPTSYPPPPTQLYRESSIEDYSDIIKANESVIDKKFGLVNEADEDIFPPLDSSPVVDAITSPRRNRAVSLRKKPPSSKQLSMRRIRSSIEIQRYAEDETDEDFSDVFGSLDGALQKAESDDGSEPSTLMLNSKLSSNSWLGDDDEDDPFAQLEEGFAEVDLETNIARDKYARVRNHVEALVGSLKISQDDEFLLELTTDLTETYAEVPETKSVIISAHGVLPILEILDTCRHPDVVLNLLKIVNAIIFNDYEIQENLCFVGGIPIINKFASKRYPREIRLEAAAFVRQMYQTSTLTLQMFVSAGGLNVLVDFLEDDYDDDRELVLIGVNGIWSVFDMQGSTPKNDFCRILSRSSVLDPLSLVLSRVLEEEGDLAILCEGRIASIFLIFSQAENYVKELIADRTVLHRVLKELKNMRPTHQITMLKFIKNLSMLSTTLDALQNSNAIDVLTELLSSGLNQPHFREMSNQILNTIYNLCRLSKRRQEDAALNGIIPLLIKIVKQERPLKEFALPILCDMAHSGRVARRELWRHKGLAFYVSLLSDPYWQVTALDAIFTWLQEETAKVEEHLLDGSFTTAIVKCFEASGSSAFENLLDPLQKILRLSPLVAASMARSDLFEYIAKKLKHHKPAIRLNILRIVRSICDSTEEQGALLGRLGVLDTIRNLELSDPAVLVRNMAQELVKSCEENDGITTSSTKRRPLRRTSSSTTPPHLLSSHSLPSSPQIKRTSQSIGYFDGSQTPRHRNGINAINTSLALRPTSRDGSSPAMTPAGSARNAIDPAKSRLPRSNTSHRLSRQPTNSSTGSKGDRTTPTSQRPPSSLANARRLRQASGESHWS